MALTQAPVLSIPNFTKQFIIETDASTVAVGAVLPQDKHPIAYFSKKLCPRMQKASTYIRELYAITTTIAKWRHYLLGGKFLICTDQQSLRSLMHQVVQTPEQQYYLTKMLGYDYEIIYKPGANNAVADALSRRPDHRGHGETFLAITVPKFLLIDNIKREQDEACELKDMDWKNAQYRTMSDGLFLFHGKVYIPRSSSLKDTLIKEFHCSPIGGHGGIHKTLMRLSADFYWQNMRADVSNYIKMCVICQQVKALNTNPYGLLQPLEIPQQIWEEVSMDFITHLPASQSYTTIFVVVDILSKSAHFGALPSSYTASKVAELFWEIVGKFHGVPKVIVSDRDSIFLSKF